MAQALYKDLIARRGQAAARVSVRLAAIIGIALGVVCALLLSAASAGAASFEWEGATINGVNSGQIATDGAGRVYVPIRNGGRVVVYDNARGGNRPLATIGQGLLQDPSAVAVDNRGNIYIADAGRSVLLLYGPYITGANYAGTSGGPGTALGQFGGLQALAADIEPRVYTAESLNARVQSLDPARGALTPMFAFGTADPAPWGTLSGLALDYRNYFYVSSSSAGTAPRVFDPRGAFVAQIGGAGSGFGQTDAARGIATDPVGRVLVADTGNNRVAFFNSQAGGFGAIDTFGSAGGGNGQFNGPASLATAPGALLYVADAGNARIVRLRYDDADHDSAIDATDNCPGQSNQSQIDHDGDNRGDDCDGDIDGDGFVNAGDACPYTRPYTDINRDGCQDPFTTAVAPKSKAKVKKSRALKVSGRASADALGVARVNVAVARKRGGKCAWYSAAKKSFVSGSCLRPRYVRATGHSRWRLTIPARSVKTGSYRIYTRAVQRKSGLAEPARAARSVFSVVD